MVFLVIALSSGWSLSDESIRGSTLSMAAVTVTSRPCSPGFASLSTSRRNWVTCSV